MPRSAFSPLSFSVLAVLALAQTAGGQGTITLAAGVGGPALVAPGAKLAVPIAVDMTAATAGTNLASLTSMASWSATRLTLDSVTAGTFGSLTSNVTSGSATLSLFSGSGTTTSVTIGTLYFTASATAGGTQIRLTPSVAGDELGASILPLLRTRNLDVCVSMSGLWGDANGDLTVNIIDAQQIARFSVGLTVANATAIAAQGDVTGDNQVNIIDAQQIARFSVGLTAAARVNTTIALTPAVASVTVPLAAGSVQVGQTAQLTATPLDASDLPLTGCSPVSWSSSDAAKATVNSSGVVTGVAPGAVTITATAGGQTAQIGVNVGIGTVPASMAIVQGNGQYRRGGTSYGVNPGVRVLDAQQRAVPSVAVTFSAVAGPSVTALTDSTGLAQAVGWTGGGNSVPVEVDGGGTQLATTTTFTAASAGLASVTFTGTGLNSEVGATACLLTTAGATYCQGEYESTNLTDRASSDTLLGRLPVLVANGVPLASLSPTVYGEFSCGVAAGGQGYCWGWNQAGQLGDGTLSRSTGFRAVAGGLSFSKIASGYLHTCGLTTAGRAYCWGLGQYGQLGNGTIGGNSSTPVPVSGNLTFADIATAADASCGVTTNGQTWCWGSATYLNNLGRASPIPKRILGSPAFSRIALGITVACGMTSAGQVGCWGRGGPALGDGTSTDRFDSFSSAPMPAPAREIWGVLDDFCAAATNGGLYCWGQNAFSGAGIAGVGDAQARSVPTFVSYANPARGQKGVASFCFQAQNNQPFCFGKYNLGDGTSGNVTRFAPYPVVWVEGTNGTVASIAPNGGDNQSSTAGTAIAIPPSVVARDFTGAVVSGATVTFAIGSGGGSLTGATATSNASGIATVGNWTLGASLGANTLTATAGGVAAVVRATATVAPATIALVSGNNQIQLGVGQSSQAAGGVFLAPLTVVVKDAANAPIQGVSVTFDMTTGGGTFQGPTSRIVSTDGNGQASLFWTARTGTIQTATATLPGLAPVTFTGLIGSALAGQARCELTTAGAAYCWGDNRRGQIGDGTLVNRSQATAVSGALTFASLAEGSADHSCGLTAAGQAYCWGANSFGQLGDGSTTDRTAPTPVSGGFTFTQVAVSPYRTCGRTAAGWLICWGWSGADLFGDGVLGVVRSPLQVGAGGVSFASVALGQSNACAVSAGGTIYCWGLGTSGQIGDGQLISRSTPTPLTDGRSYSAVSVGVSHVCGLTVAGAAFCWGNGPLGTGATTSSSTPAPVTGGLTFTSIAASPSGHTCARATTGVAYCWGSTSAGITDVRFGPQLGDGTIIARLVPTAVLSGVSFASVSVRSGFSCGRRSGGQPYCWGANSLGQLGDLTTTVRATPVATRWVEGTAGAPVSLINNGFSTQTLAAGTAVASPPSVLVRDFAGAPVSGVTVTFAVTSGGGVVTAATATTNASGIATVGSWTLGPVAGVNTLTASAPSLPTVVFTATGS